MSKGGTHPGCDESCPNYATEEVVALRAKIAETEAALRELCAVVHPRAMSANDRVRVQWFSVRAQMRRLGLWRGPGESKKESNG